MKLLHITKDVYAKVDDADYEFLASFSWWLSRKGYPVTRIKDSTRKRGKRNVYMHRLLIAIDPGFVTDHINRDRLDNRRENLRMATLSENQHNSGLRKNNKSGFRGVSRTGTDKNPWVAKLCWRGRAYHLGCFATPEEANKAYQHALHNPETLSPSTVRRWTAEEEYLLGCERTRSVYFKDIAKSLNRTEGAVRLKWRKLCL